MIHIVDDDPVLGQMLTEMVSLLSDNPIFFSSATEYLKYMKNQDYQKPLAIFTDINMPDMNGYELLESVQAINPDQRFVVVTGRPDFEHAYKNHACLYLSKPFRFEDLQRVISALARCEHDGPSDAIGCEGLCDRSDFLLEEWSCPHLNNSANA